MMDKFINRCLTVGWLTGWILLLGLLVVLGILLLSNITVIHAYNETGDLLIEKKVTTDTTIQSRYIHSVARCPMIEKFAINDDNDFLLMESWNCSFGAGIEAEKPQGAMQRMEDGYLVYDEINKPLSQFAVHAALINEQMLKIDDQTWNFSEEPFLDETIELYIKEESRLIYWWHKLQVH